METMSVLQIAAYLRVDKTTVRRWIRRGQLPAAARMLSRDGVYFAYIVKREDLDRLTESK